MAECRNCGDEFTPDNAGLPGADKVYCCNLCRLSARRGQQQKDLKRRRQREKGCEEADAPLVWQEVIATIALLAIEDCPGPDTEDCASCTLVDCCLKASIRQIGRSG